METALRASHCVDISTKAIPLGWPVCLSADNLDRHDISSFGEKGFEFRFAGLEREVGYVNLLIHIFLLRYLYLLKHSIHNSFLSFGGGTWVTTSFPQPEHKTL